MAINTSNGGATRRESTPVIRKAFAFDPFADFAKERYNMSSLLNWAFRPHRPYAEMAAFDVDLYEKDGKMVAECELPGFEKDDIDIAVAENRLTISAQNFDKRSEREAGFAYRERRLGRFERSFTFADPIDASAVNASYRNGVLRVEFPLTGIVESKRIDIKG
jgi:HSP20 family protein